MTAAILFLFLLVGSTNADAAGLNYPAALVPTANINQPLLGARSELSKYKIPTYRGGAEDLIHSTVTISTNGGHGAGVVLVRRQLSSSFQIYLKLLLNICIHSL